MADGHDLAMALRAAYLAMHRRTGAEMAELGLTADQFVLLTALVDGEALTQKELVERTCSDPNTLSERLARLEHRGLIVRERRESDGRARSVALTAEGRRAQKQTWDASEPLRQALQDLFRPGILDTLVDHLERIAIAMEPTNARVGP